MKPSALRDKLNKIVEGSPNTVLYIEGEMGIGKTQIVETTTKENKIPLVTLRLATQEPGDLIGIPREKDSVTIWSMPEWLNFANQHPKGIIFLDEVNRAPVDVRQAIFQFVEQKRLHTHQLNPGWIIVAAGNPPAEAGSTYQVEVLDPAFMRRMHKITLEVDVDEFLLWARENKLDEVVLQFITAQPELLHIPPAKIEGDISPNPAGYERLSDLIKMHVINFPTMEPEDTELIKGTIGSKAAIAFQGFVKDTYQRPLTAKEIFEKPGWTEKVKKEFFDSQKAGKNDKIMATVRDIISYIKAGNLKTDKKKEIFLKLLKDERLLPANRIIFIKDLDDVPDAWDTMTSDPEFVDVVEEEIGKIKAKDKDK